MNKNKKTVDNRNRLERGCFQNKSFASSYFQHALCVELWGERKLPGVSFFLPDHSWIRDLRLVCQFEHVFSAPSHHVPVVDPRHGWGGQAVKENIQNSLKLLKDALTLFIPQKDLFTFVHRTVSTAWVEGYWLQWWWSGSAGNPSHRWVFLDCETLFVGSSLGGRGLHQCHTLTWH